MVGPDLFVASGDLGLYSGNSSVTELDAATGVLVRVISGPRYDFYSPRALVLAGGLLFVASSGRSCEPCAPDESLSLVQPSTGALVRVISAKNSDYELGDLDAMAASGDHLFVTGGGAGGGAVTEIAAPSGALVRVIQGPRYAFNALDAIAAFGDQFFVASPWTNQFPGGAVTEVSAVTGLPLKVWAGPPYEFELPEAMAVAGGTLYVANSMGGSITAVPLTGPGPTLGTERHSAVLNRDSYPTRATVSSSAGLGPRALTGRCQANPVWRCRGLCENSE